MSKQTHLTKFAKYAWRKRVVTRAAISQMRRGDNVAELSGIHAWSLRVPFEETSKVLQLCRRIERRYLHRTDPGATLTAEQLREDGTGKLIAVKVYLK